MNKKIISPDTPETRKALNKLAREQMKQRLLQDVLLDINICRLENWDIKEYVNEICELLKGLV